MRISDELITLIKDRTGDFNLDIMAGWEAGLRGREKVGRKLFDRMPPDHFTGTRYQDWIKGRNAASSYKASLIRTVTFYGKRSDGTESVLRFKGWNVTRSTIVTQMERDGVRGNVDVYYTENGNIKRKVCCGI